MSQGGFDMREWQRRCFYDLKKKMETTGIKDYLIVATPGGGKTKMSLSILKYMFNNQLAQRAIVVVPTVNLKKQWARSAHEIGIELDPIMDGGEMSLRGYDGVCTTYASIGVNPEPFWEMCFKTKTMVILDEVHHTGENLTWGDGVKRAFESAVFRLCLSGTAFRSDTNKIPFIRYENNVSKADFTYSYKDAVIDNVCRSVFFYAIDGLMEWEVDSESETGETETLRFKHSFKDYLERGQASRRLKTALSVDGNWIKHVLTEAHKKLIEIRKHHFKAGGLIFASNQNHAREIANILMEICQDEIYVAISDDKKSNDTIQAFADSSDPWLVCVKMVSEGVDIPRLRVGAYMTNVKAELFFRQAVGRFVRVLAELPSDQPAYVYIPADKDLVDMATDIESERDHALDEIDEQERADRRKKAVEDAINNPPVRGDFNPISAEAAGEAQFRLEFEIDDIIKNQRVKTKKIGNALAIGDANISVRREDSAPLYQRVNRLRYEIGLLAKRYAKQVCPADNIDWNIAHSEWIHSGGKNISKESLEELTARRDWLKSRVQL